MRIVRGAGPSLRIYTGERFGGDFLHDGFREGSGGGDCSGAADGTHVDARGGRGAQRDLGDLRPGAEPEGNAPVAGAGIDVEQRVAGLVPAHRVIEKGRGHAPAEGGQRELSPVRMTGERQRHAALGERGPERGIVGQCQDRNTGRHLLQRGGDVDATLGGIVTGGGITGAGDGERGAVARDGAGLIHQQVASQPVLEAPRDVAPAGVDVVVARDDEHAQWCGQRSHDIGISIGVLRVIIDQVAGDGDELGLERLDGGDDAREPGGRELRPDVQVGELHDAGTIEARRKVRDLRGDVAYDQLARTDVAGDEGGGDQRRDAAGEKAPARQRRAEGQADRDADDAGDGHQRQHELDVPERPHDPEPVRAARRGGRTRPGRGRAPAARW